MHDHDPGTLRVTYMELRQAPAPAGLRLEYGHVHVSCERLNRVAYLDLYKKVGGPSRWDQRLKMPDAELGELLAAAFLHIYVLRNVQQQAWILRVRSLQVSGAAALHAEWTAGATRIWLHTDTWDHPAAIRVYETAGFSVYCVRDEEAATL